MISEHVNGCIKRWGGSKENYEPINTFLDSSKTFISDWRHRVLLHNTLGVALVELLFPKSIKIDSKEISSRTIAEMHILEDLGAVPSTRWTLCQLESCPSFTLPDHLDVYFNEEELQVINTIYLQALDKSLVYYTSFIINILCSKFGQSNIKRYIEGILYITNKDYILSPQDFLYKLPPNSIMGNYNPSLIRRLQQFNERHV
jgi:hypothetical protein